MKSRRLIYVAVAAGSMTLAGLTISHLRAQAVPAAAERQSDPQANQQVNPKKVVISVGGQKYTAEQYEAFVASLPPDARALNTGPSRRTLGEEYARLKILSAEAQKRGLENSETFKRQMEIMRDNLLVGVLLQEMQDKLVTDAEISKYYDANKASFEQVKARHILIAVDPDKGLTDAQAKAKAAEIKAKLENGAKFEDLAKAESADPGTKDKGGELDPFPRGVMVKEFEDAAFSLEPGKISDPVKTEYGYHIIQVEKREIPTLDAMKDAIGDKLRQEKFEEWYNGLKKNANPQFDEEFFPKPPATEPAAGKAE